MLTNNAATAYAANYLNLLSEVEDYAIVLLDNNANIVDWNKGAQKIKGYTKAEIIGKNFKIFYTEEDQKAGLPEKLIAQASVTGKAEHEGWRVKKDGSVFWGNIVITALKDEHDNLVGFGKITRDLTDRKAIENQLTQFNKELEQAVMLRTEKLEAANRLYHLISQINQTIVHTTDEQNLFQKACNIATEYGQYPMATIGKIDHEENTISLVAESGATTMDHQLFKKIQLHPDSPTCQVKETGNYIIINDIANTQFTAGWKDYLIGKGFLSTCILPIKQFGEVIAIFNLCSSQQNRFDKEEMALLEEVIGDLSFAVENYNRAHLRLEMEDKIAKHDNLLKKAQEIALLGSYELDMRTMNVTWSDEMFRIFGMESQSVAPSIELFFSFLHPDDQGWMQNEFGKLQHDFKDLANRFRIIRVDGRLRHVYSEARFELDNKGMPLAMYGFIHDVTKQVDTEEQLIKNEKYMRSIIENNADGIVLVNDAMDVVYASPNSKKLIGFDPEEILGPFKAHLIHPDYMLEVMDAYQKVIENPQSSQLVEYLSMKKDGTYIWVEANYSNHYDDEDIRALIINYRDVSVRKLAEEKLKESTFLLEKAQQVAHVGHWVSTTDGTGALSWSDETYRIFGLDKETSDIRLELFYSMVHPDDLENVLIAQNKAFARQEAYDIEHRIIRPDGSIRWVREQADITWANEGKPESMIGVCKDITERKKGEENIKTSEAALRVLNSELEERVLQRTGELIDANQELEAFSYTVSHDLRTPIRAVQIFGNLLKSKFKENTDETIATYLDNILTCTVEMNDLINDLLAFSKLGRHELKKTHVDIDEMAHAVTASVTSIEEGREITIDIDELDSIDADATLIRSIWLNLISNAVKYSKKGTHCLVHISSEKKNGVVIYQVADNGIGFDMKYYDRLFKPFSRLHTSSDYKGSGTGLAISHRIIKKHGGELWAESIVNEGSTFYFSLPIK